ncbi:Ig-like domain-containing protein [Bacillus sp. A301a_S52]|nr:Ig-like domain-containing protein [Bacillus sp. A301a_S52]
MKKVLSLCLFFLLIPQLVLAEEVTINLAEIDDVVVLDKLKDFEGEPLEIKGEDEDIHSLQTEVEKIAENDAETIEPLDTPINDSPNNAYSIDIDGVYQDVLTEEGQTKWYLFENIEPGKLTVFLQTVNSENIDYDLHLFKLNEDTMTLENQLSSTYGPGMNEQLAQISDGGIYFVAVSSWEGYDENTPFYFTVLHSSDYDSQEPDDNIWQATLYNNEIQVNGTVDNEFDLDWKMLSLDEEKILNTRLAHNADASYQLDIFDMNLNLLASFSDNQSYNNYVFPEGDYFIRVASTSSYDAMEAYNLSMTEAGPPPSRVNVTRIDSDGGVQGYIDYGYGNFWRIRSNITIHGQLLDNNGNPVANAPVEFTVIREINNTPISGASTTDSDGNFSVNINNIGPAAGYLSYYTGYRIHYFDLIPLIASSNSVQLQSNESGVYHFAYSTF